MEKRYPYTINIGGHLMDLGIPKVMGILNVTPDSFYAESRRFEEDAVRRRVEEMLSEGVDIIDIGGCSTRPGYEAPDEDNELKRVELGCRIVREISQSIPLSVDTFRSRIAATVIKDWNVNIINDVSGGQDSEMPHVIAENKVVYVLTHNRVKTENYNDVTAEVITELSQKLNELHRSGVNDIILDPGFGFAKNIEDNFRLLEELGEIAKIGLPLLVGISRKSMIYKSLGCTPEESLVGTVALDAISLEKGANILRVHDVKAAVETVKLFNRLKGAG